MLAELQRDKELIDRLLKDAALSLPAEEFIKLKQAVIKMLDKYQQAVSILTRIITNRLLNIIKRS